jgi:RNA polymerase sigma factor (sigma-70 family)
MPPSAVDDVVQEAYCRIVALSDVNQIKSGRAYFFRTVSNIVIDQIRRARIVPIESGAEIEALNVVSDEATPERIVAGYHDLLRVKALIAGLPERCRRVFELRRIQGLSQKEVAQCLGVTENVVEQQSIRGLRLILKALTQAGEGKPAVLESRKWYERSGKRGRS